MSLKEIVGGMVMTSEVTGKLQERALEKGLILCVTVGKKITELKLKRRGSKPGLVEWRTVLEVWPYPVGEVSPVESVEAGYNVLAASWSTPARLALGA